MSASEASPRLHVVPRVHDLRLLEQLLERLAEGLREPRALADVLGIDLRSLDAYVQLGEWLGFLEAPVRGARGEDLLRLSRSGLQYAFSPRRRRRLYAENLWSRPIARELRLPTRETPPSVQDLVHYMRQRHPEMSTATAVGRARTLRVLLEPAFSRRPSSAPCGGVQLTLGFPSPRRPATEDGTQVKGVERGGEEDPALYRRLLQYILDEGEVAVSHVRCILDRAGAEDAPVGSYVEMALRRGDAYRWSDGLLDKLVVTRGAVRRRDLSDTVASVALSDPDYRAYLEVLQRAERGDPTSAFQYGRMRARFASWDRRLFGASARPRDVARAVQRLLLGRPLDVFPVARPVAELKRHPEPGPFLEQLSSPLLVVALPPSIDLLVGGVKRVNEHLQERIRGPQRVALPGPVDARVVVHGGLLHPGERIPRSIADGVSLRLRAISRIPHLACLTALLLHHRRARGRLALRARARDVELVYRRRRRGMLLPVLDQLISSWGAIVSRRHRGGLDALGLVEVAQALGICTEVDGLLLLDEALFLRMGTEPEDAELYDGLLVLADRLEAGLERMHEAHLVAQRRHRRRERDGAEE